MSRRGLSLEGRGLKRGLHSAETKHHASPHDPPHLRSAAERGVAHHWGPFRALGLPQGIADSPKAYVMVNGGRWIVPCPFCASAEYASKQDHRFFCTDCGNIDVGGQWLHVIWPENWQAIEQALFRRPKMVYRNWLQGESLDDLAQQDLEAAGHTRGVILPTATSATLEVRG